MLASLTEALKVSTLKNKEKKKSKMYFIGARAFQWEGAGGTSDCLSTKKLRLTQLRLGQINLLMITQYRLPLDMAKMKWMLVQKVAM